MGTKRKTPRKRATVPQVLRAEARGVRLLEIPHRALRTDAARRQRAHRLVRALAEAGLVAELAAMVQIEAAQFGRGAGAQALGRAVAAGVELAEYCMRLVRDLPDDGGRVGDGRSADDRRWLKHLTAFEAASWEALRELRPVLDQVAGLGGGGLCRLRGVPFRSGLEALAMVAASLHRALASDEREPFGWLGISVGAPPRRRPQRNRPRPPGPEGLEDDDRACLLALAEGCDGPKAVRTWIERARLGRWGYDHVRKRGGDLRRWGLIEGTRRWVLSGEGQAWAASVRTASPRPPSQGR